MNATQELIRRDPNKTIVPFGSGAHHQFSHADLQHVQDPSGISEEEGDFLYGLIRLTQPRVVLETGSNVGVSASYICLGMEHNGFGHLDTIEHLGFVADIARQKLGDMGFSNVTVHTTEVSQFEVKGKLDFLWLDSELNQRFDELVRFFPSMNPGAIACIHDLWALDWKEFSPIPIELLELLKTGELRAMTFDTPHGVSVFQRRRENDFLGDLAKS